MYIFYFYKLNIYFLIYTPPQFLSDEIRQHSTKFGVGKLGCMYSVMGVLLLLQGIAGLVGTMCSRNVSMKSVSSLRRHRRRIGGDTSRRQSYIAYTSLYSSYNRVYGCGSKVYLIE